MHVRLTVFKERFETPFFSHVYNYVHYFTWGFGGLEACQMRPKTSKEPASGPPCSPAVLQSWPNLSIFGLDNSPQYINSWPEKGGGGGRKVATNIRAAFFGHDLLLHVGKKLDTTEPETITILSRLFSKTINDCNSTVINSEMVLLKSRKMFIVSSEGRRGKAGDVKWCMLILSLVFKPTEPDPFPLFASWHVFN